jgi:hypothetical protein
MGHARVTNISKAVNHNLHRGPCSIKQIVDYLIVHKQTVHAGEGELEDTCMLSQATQDVMSWLYDRRVVEPVNMTTEQEKIFRQWGSNAMTNWDCGNDGNGGEYAIFDSIQWRPLRKRLPILNYVSH